MGDVPGGKKQVEDLSVYSKERRNLAELGTQIIQYSCGGNLTLRNNQKAIL